MTSQLAATEDLAPVKGIVYYGFPLHAPGKIGTERAAHLNDIPLPQLFLQGTRDTFAKTDLIEEVCAALPLAKLVLIEGGDHSFKMLKRSGITQKEAIQKEVERIAKSLGTTQGQLRILLTQKADLEAELIALRAAIIKK